MSQTFINEVGEDVVIQLYERVHYKQKGRGPRLDEKQKGVLKQAWTQWVKGDATKAGMDMFLRLWERHPRTKDVFEFARGSGAAQMQNSARVIFHVTRVVNYLDKVVNNIDNLEDVVPMLLKLSGRHASNGYQVPPEFFGLLGDAMVDSVRQAVPALTRDAEAALRCMYEWVNDQFRDGMARYNVGSNRS